MSELPPNAISACLAVRNEERQIERCLRSLEGVVDETVLVHSGPCEDATIEIAEWHGARVVTADDGGHGERNTPIAYGLARGEWLLNIDADEFLSDELRANLRRLAEDGSVDGYAFLWKLWDGRRYITEHGPYKLVMFRRSKTRMVGLIHAPERVEGRVVELPLHLEHRPSYNNYTLHTIATKWRRWAEIQAREYTSDLASVPRFNIPGEVRWSRRRRMANRLAPVLILPAAAHTFVYVLRSQQGLLRPRDNLRFALGQALYRAMVTAYVARFVYLTG
jgi:glycosyl transferase family 2